jgi:ribosome-associated translation inhibitor RaiA
MRYNLELKAMGQEDVPAEEREIGKLIDRKISALSKKVKAFAPDEILLRVLVEQIPAHHTYHVSVTLDAPGKTLAAKGQRSKIASPISAAFADIERQFDAYCASRRGEHDWKRLARRQELRGHKTAPALPESDQV